MGTEIARVDNVSKRFVIHQDKSVKERLVNFARSRAYREDFWALTDVSLRVDAGETLGLIGANGSGKSTLLKIIGSIIQPTTGTVQRRGRIAALLELGAGFHPDLTGRENVYLNAAILGLTQAETRQHFDEIVDFSGIEQFIDTQVKFYSSGMFVRLAFAVAVHVDPDMLLVDEVLAVGDEPFQRKCMDKIAQFQDEGRTIIVVSHSAQQIGELCHRVAVLDHGRLAFEGATAEGLQVLRSSFDRAAAEAAPELSGGESHVGPHITGLRVSGERGGDGKFASGSDLSIEFSYRQKSAPAGWIAGVDIENALGQRVYRVNSQGLGTTMPTAAGGYRLTIDLPDNAFGGGAYRVYGSCVTAAGETLNRLKEPATFEIADDLRGGGLLQFASRGTLESL